MEIQKKTTELLKKILWADTITTAQLAAAQSASASIEKGVTDPEVAWTAYETTVAARKLTPMKKRKFQELLRELAKPANRDVVHYCASLSVGR